MNSLETIAISGATGFIGLQLCLHFVQKGYHVIGLCRTIPPEKIDKVEYRIFDLEKPTDTQLFMGATVFIHGAYLKGEGKKSSNIEGTKKLLNASRNAGVKRNIFFSSMSAHADALSDYGQQKYEIEKLFSGNEDVIIRPGLVIGKGGLFSGMVNHILSVGIIPLIGGGGQPLYSVHVSDVLEAVEIIVKNKLSGMFTVAETEAVLYKEFYSELGKSLGKNVWMFKVSYSLLEKVLTLTGLLGIKTGIGKENLLGLKGLKEARFTNKLEAFGFQPMNYKQSLAILSKEYSSK